MITGLKGVAAKLDELTMKHIRAEIANGPLLQELIKSFPVGDVDKTEKKDKKKKGEKVSSAPAAQKEKLEKAQFSAEVSRCKQKQQPPQPQQKQQSQKTFSHGESSLEKEPDKKIDSPCLSKKEKKAPGKKISPIHQPQAKKASKKQVERSELPITTDVIYNTQDLQDVISAVSSADIIEQAEINEDVTKELAPEESVQQMAQMAVPQFSAEPVQLEEKPVSQPAKKQLICSLETALPTDVREKLLPILLPFGTVFITGGSARKGIFSQCYPDKVYEASDVDLVINVVESGKCDSLILSLVEFGFKKSLVDEVWTYHPNSQKGKYVDSVFYPPVAAAFTTIIDIKIIALKAQEKPLPCFKIDTLSIEVFSKDEGRFYPTTEDFFDIVWNHLDFAINPPTIEDLIEHNTETVFRALRLMYIHKLYDSTPHDKLLKQICDAGNILKRQNFGQFNSMLRKFFCRGNAWGFMKCGSGDAFLAVRNAFLSILQPAFPEFCKTIMGSDSNLKSFILSELSEFDKDSSLDFNQRLDKMYTLLLLSAYLKLSEQCSGKQGIDDACDFTRKAFSSLLKENFISSSSGVDSSAAWIERDGKLSAKSIIAEYLDKLQQKFKLSKPLVTNGACCTFFNVAAKPFVPAALQKNPSCS